MEVLDHLALAISLMGVLMLAWGALKTLWGFLQLETAAFRGRGSSEADYVVLRHSFGGYLLLGLEFLIAADILHTLIKPDREGLILLGAIVAIRTVISYFLNRELQQSPHRTDLPGNEPPASGERT